VRRYVLLFAVCSLAFPGRILAQAQRVVDIPTRPGVTQRMVVIEPEKPKAAVVLFAGGHGGLQITSTGDFKWGEANFLVRSRRMFSSNGLMVVVVDAPSDRQNPPYLGGFRQTAAHVSDIKAVIAWVRRHADIPVWLVGTSRGTQSVAFIATQLARADGGPDGIVLSSTMLADKPGNRPVPEMSLDGTRLPTLVAHHRRDGCEHCRYGDLPNLMEKLTNVSSKELLTIEGGRDRGDPCDAMAHHGFNGVEEDVVKKISDWVSEKKNAR
jgi:alpha/beta superfamily hydrolase